MKLIEPPPRDAALEAALEIDRQRLRSLEAMAASTVQAFRHFWHHSEATPAQILEKLGTNAARAFEDHAAAVAFLLGRGVEMSPADYTPPVAYEAQEDGRVVITG